MRALKGNQGQLHEAVQDDFETARRAQFKGTSVQSVETVDSGHGRVEQRRSWLSTDLHTLPAAQAWPGLKAIGWVESQRHQGDAVSVESRDFIASLTDVRQLRNGGALALADRECAALAPRCDLS